MLVALTISVQKKFSKSLIWLSLLELATGEAFAFPHGEVKLCGSALKKALNGDTSVTISPVKCPLSAAVGEWASCQKKASFTKIRTFLKNHSSWPAQETLRKKAEEDLSSFTQSSKVVLEWFEKYPPLTAKGALVYAQALQELKPNSLEKKLIPIILSVSFSEGELRSFLEKYHSSFKKDSLADKAHSLLDKQENSALIKVILPYLAQEDQKVINLRLNPVNQETLSTTTHSGIIFDMVRLCRKTDQTDQAVKLLKIIPEIPTFQAESFWGEQNILARRLIEQKRYQEAYDIVHKHNLSSGEAFANAEWMAGWLSLRFLKNPEQALVHFKKLRDKVKSPISVARASYWLGRTYKELKDKEESIDFFKEAATHLATYYGQLAKKELSGKIHPITLKKSTISKEVRQKFDSHQLVQVIKILLELGETSKAETFAVSLTKQLTSPKEQELLVALMHEKGGRYLGVQTAKKATITAAPLIPEAYPRLSNIPKGTIEPALAHAIIRQESRFKSDAVSPAGAVGLMQLMPATANKTMKKHKLKKGSLTHEELNVSVGTRHLKDLLSEFNGSMILAAAAYNAGKNAVTNWLVTFGDPRDSSVDTIDWVELIPYAETRNYVQRVLENYYCYL